MRRFVVVVLVVGGIAALCALARSGPSAAGRVLDASVVGWVALAALALGTLWGARYARTERSWIDYRTARRQARTTRRTAIRLTGLAARFALFIAAAAATAVYLTRKG